MSKYHVLCSCVVCRVEITVQSLTGHINKHLNKPKTICQCCNKPTNNLQFCSHSCRAKVMNARRGRKVNLTWEEALALRLQKHRQNFQDGKITERATLRKHIAATRGYKCSVCSVETWNNLPITLVVDHIDGNASNNMPNNLRLLCPNCNSQTSTFGGRNKGNGRKFRGLPLN